MHPGEYISMTYIEAMEMTQSEIAKCLNISPSTLSRIIAGQIDLTADMALRFERVFGRSAESWMDMQVKYSLAKGRKSLALDGVNPIKRRELEIA